jgi:hypothetical protein
MQEAYKFTESSNISILTIFIFNYILLKLKIILINMSNIKTFVKYIIDIIRLWFIFKIFYVDKLYGLNDSMYI